MAYFRTCVSFGVKERSFGNDAKSQMVTNSKNTIWGWKKLIGRQFNDPQVQQQNQMLPYEIVSGPDGSAGIKVGIFVKRVHIVRTGSLHSRIYVRSTLGNISTFDTYHCTRLYEIYAPILYHHWFCMLCYCRSIILVKNKCLLRSKYLPLCLAS